MNYDVQDIEPYLLLITDIFFSNFVLLPESELILSAMQCFSNYNLYLIFISIFIALFLVGSVNYFLGNICFYIYLYLDSEDLKMRYSNLLQWFNKYFELILLLTILPLIGKMLVFVAGFCRLSSIKTIMFFVVMRVVYYFFFF